MGFLLLTVSSSPLVLGKPQYGAAPPVQTPVSAPVVQAPSQISCFTTQETIWDTQYIEKTEKECHQEQIQKFRQACQTVYKTPVKLSTNRCAANSTGKSRSLTQRQSAVVSKRRTASLGGRRTGTEARSGWRCPAPASRTTTTPVATFRSRNWFRFPTLTARMFQSSNASRCLSNSASRSPTQLPSRYARMCTGRSLRGLAGRCQRRPAEVATVVAVGQLHNYQRGRPAMGVADTGRDRAATSLCSQGLLEVPTPAPMLKAPPKPGLAVMPSTLVKFVKVFQFVHNIFDWNAST